MFRFVFDLIDLVLRLYALAVVVYYVATLLKAPGGKWLTLLGRVVEPVVQPIRRVLNERLPQSWQIMDWAPIALLLLITVLRWIIL